MLSCLFLLLVHQLILQYLRLLKMVLISPFSLIVVIPSTINHQQTFRSSSILFGSSFSGIFNIKRRFPDFDVKCFGLFILSWILYSPGLELLSNLLLLLIDMVDHANLFYVSFYFYWCFKRLGPWV